ncbi:hypothetical protein DV736_g448, partial [Chaetothyriales sp. CBS 134916]
MGPLRSAQARVRPRRAPAKVVDGFDDLDRDELSTAFDDEPPLKRIRTARTTTTRSRWIPGGRGGGGRHVDLEELESIVAPSPSKDNYARASASARVARSTPKKVARTPRVSARSRNRNVARPRYSTAAAASAAVTHGDGYKPREERGWEEFHPDLDLEFDFAIIHADEVDGRAKKVVHGDGSESVQDDTTTPKRRPGRPQRTQSTMLASILIPETPKFVPPPGPNPRERLTLPKPSFRELDPFQHYEHGPIAQQDFVDKTMASVGYQESEIFVRPDRHMIRQTEGSAEEDLDLSPDLIVNGENSAIGSSGVGRVEYDMDEQDVKWLDSMNKIRIKDGVGAIKPAIFEITMTKIEKEWHALEKRIPKPNPKAPQTQRPRSSSAAAVNGEPTGEEGDTKCAICDDGDCENANAIVFCDGCDLAVHQECYGVPYIPEGQWLCRKCQLVGNSRPSCIFCPHGGGAFKQTNNSKWAHLFCAIWIPEVQIGNPSLMEPITDVEKVPPSRWKLNCYICLQAMGACIQCSDGRCYRAFHLTCARQAGLSLRMKTGGGQNTLMDQSVLRAYCHQHADAGWRADHNTEKAYETTRRYCKSHFKNTVWADSRTSALAIAEERTQPAPADALKVALSNKKGKQKTIWRLPSGAPVIPEVILKSIEDSLVRFSVSKKKEYVSEVCKYWTLKREARRGAALLKRLQLQMDTFSSFEVTRRDYKAQGPIGRARLDRRIDFAELLQHDLERIRQICELVKQREFEKLNDARLLKDVVDTVYFPIPSLLEPIIDKAIKHDRGYYRNGLVELAERNKQGLFVSVTSFSADLVQVFAPALGGGASTFAEIIEQVTGRAENMAQEDRDRRAVARRVLKAIQPQLEDAIRKEGELTGRPYAQQLKELDDALLSRRGSVAGSEVAVESVEMLSQTNGVSTPQVVEVKMADAPPGEAVEQFLNGSLAESVDDNKPAKNGNVVHTPTPSTNGLKHDGPPVNGAIVQDSNVGPPTPPMSLEGQTQPAFGAGGIPWYVEQFDPEGTTIYEERWTGQQVLRELSEELSEMDEEELGALGADEMDIELDQVRENTIADELVRSPNKKGGAKKKGKRRGDFGNKSFGRRASRR